LKKIKERDESRFLTQLTADQQKTPENKFHPFFIIQTYAFEKITYCPHFCPFSSLLSIFTQIFFIRESLP